MRYPPVLRSALLVGVGFVAFAGGFAVIGSARSEPQPAVDEVGDSAMQELREHHRHHHHGGITQLIAMSLDTLGEDEAKRPQVEKLQDDLRACLAPARDLEKRVLKAIAEGVAVGAIDAARVDATIAQLGSAADGVHSCSAPALNTLHANLSASERQALAEKVRAHYGVWRRVNHEAAAGGREKGGRLADLTEELGLTPDQVEKMSAALHAAEGSMSGKFDSAKGEGHVQAFTTAFVGETFDANTVTANANGHLAMHGARRMAIFYETITPLLTPEQRTKLAEHLQQHAAQGPAGVAK